MRSVLPLCMLVPCALVGWMADIRSGQRSVWMWWLRMHGEEIAREGTADPV